jgi:hypothetical protein
MIPQNTRANSRVVMERFDASPLREDVHAQFGLA